MHGNNNNSSVIPERSVKPASSTSTSTRPVSKDAGPNNGSFPISNPQVEVAPQSGVFFTGMNMMMPQLQPTQQLMQPSPFFPMFNNSVGQHNVGSFQAPAPLENFQRSQSNSSQLSPDQIPNPMNYMMQSQASDSFQKQHSVKDQPSTSDKANMNHMSSHEYQIKQAQMQQTQMLMYQLQQQQLQYAQMQAMQQAQSHNNSIQNVNSNAGPGVPPMPITPSMNPNLSSQPRMFGSGTVMGQDPFQNLTSQTIPNTQNIQNMQNAQFFMQQQQMQQQNSGFGGINVPMTSSVANQSMNQTSHSVSTAAHSTQPAVYNNDKVGRTTHSNEGSQLKNQHKSQTSSSFQNKGSVDDLSNIYHKKERNVENSAISTFPVMHMGNLGPKNHSSKNKRTLPHTNATKFNEKDSNLIRQVSFVPSSETKSNTGNDTSLHQSDDFSHKRRNSNGNSMNKEETESLINALSWEEKLMYVARCIMGGRATNGYYDALSRVTDLVDDLEKQTKAKRTKAMHMSGLIEVGEILGHAPLDPKAKRDLLKRSPDTALRMITEMGLGATFCDNISSVIQDILKSIEREDTLNEPREESTIDGKSSEIGNKRNRSESRKNDHVAPSGTERSISTWSFESQRFGSLKIGDYVAAKPEGENIRILSRIVRDWNEIKIPEHLSDDQKGKTLESKHYHVYFQYVEEYDIGNESTYKSTNRMNILRLPRNRIEASESLKQLRKGMRVHTIFPSTTSFYSATVVDIPPIRPENEIVCTVEFDGDEGESCMKYILPCFQNI